MASVEECTICTDALGQDATAVQLPCGHAFCQRCLDEWAQHSHTDCPQCRQTYKRSKVRPLKPWNGGLRLKDISKEETAALKALDEAKSARAHMENRAAIAERALRQMQRANAQPQQLAHQPGHCSSHVTEEPIAAPSGLSLTSAAAAIHHPAQTGAAAPSAISSRSELTEEQRQRAAANRAAALERKRERDAAAEAEAAAAAAVATSMAVMGGDLDLMQAACRPSM